MQREARPVTTVRPVPLGQSEQREWRAILAWGLFAALVVAAKYYDAPSAGNVFNIYRETGLRWLRGADLYPAEFYFNYLPTAALVFVPWALLPFDIGGALWRVLNIAVFALGLMQLCAVTAPDVGRNQPARIFAPASLIAIVLCWSAARHGQITLAMAGLMMAAAARLQRKELWWAALFATLAVAVKPPAVVFLLLACAVYPPLIWRAALLLLLLAALPFALQAPHYVVAQYAALPDMFAHRAMRTWPYPNAFGMLESLGWVASDVTRTSLRAFAAAFVVLSCRSILRWGDRSKIGFCLYTSAGCYILLGGAGTEHNTYAMLGPVVGVVAACAWRTGNTALFASMLALIAVTASSHTLMRAFPTFAPYAMLKPMVCSTLFAYVVWREWPPRRRRRAPASPAAGSADAPSPPNRV